MKQIDQQIVVEKGGLQWPRLRVRREAWPLIRMAALATILAGCAGRDLTARLQPNATRPGSVTTAPAVSSDPVIAFVGRARPGQDERVTLESGQTASVRVARAYQAASGRECREVVVSTGLEERLRLVCAAEGGWTDARPLLRGGAGQR